MAAWLLGALVISARCCLAASWALHLDMVASRVNSDSLPLVGVVEDMLGGDYGLLGWPRGYTRGTCDFCTLLLGRLLGSALRYGGF